VISRLAAELSDLKFDYAVSAPGLPNKDRDWIPSQLLTKEISTLLNIPLQEGLLLKSHQTQFHTLDRTGRLRAIKQAYQRTKEHKDFDDKAKKILLIDDLVASGLTLKACAAELKKSNDNHEIWALTFCSSRA